MRLPKDSAPPSARRDYGTYVSTRLIVAGEDAGAVQEATTAVKHAVRHVEDLAEAVPMALARRDAVDDDLDELAQKVRLGMASRSIDAAREEPYKTVFYKGLAYYINAPIAENAKRYRDLADRLHSTLPEKDPLRPHIAQIRKGADAFEVAAAAVDEARNKLGLAKTKLDAVEEEWARAMEKTYGYLISEHGKQKAERFFPALSKREEVTSDDEATTPAPA